MTARFCRASFLALAAALLLSHVCTPAAHAQADPDPALWTDVTNPSGDEVVPVVQYDQATGLLSVDTRGLNRFVNTFSGSAIGGDDVGMIALIVPGPAPEEILLDDFRGSGGFGTNWTGSQYVAGELRLSAIPIFDAYLMPIGWTDVARYPAGLSATDFGALQMDLNFQVGLPTVSIFGSVQVVQSGSIIYEQPPDGVDGYFSDAIPGQAAGQRIADDFMLSVNGDVFGLSWTGSSAGAVFDDLSNVASVVISFYESDFTQIASYTFSLAETDPVPTGDINSAGAQVFAHAVTFPGVSLTGGTAYWLSIGTINVNPAGDAYAWTASGTGNDRHAADVFDGSGFQVLPAAGDAGFALLAGNVSFPDGACCFEVEPLCEFLSDSACQAAGGAWQGPGTSCVQLDCQVACCLDDGTCFNSNTIAVCLANGGVPQGYGTPCATADCPPAGACCFEAVPLCDDLTESACTAAGGAWQGAGTSCSQSDCLVSCCLDDGGCVSQNTAADCLAIGGAPQGFGSNCATANCPPGGACCFESAPTCDNLTESACTAAGGAWQGAGTSCSQSDCQVACCLDDGSCVSRDTMTTCLAIGGLPQDYGSNCATANCPPGGACCFESAPTCDDLTESACTAAGGAWQGAGTSCSQSDCQVACCLDDGSCVSRDTMTTCLAIGGLPQDYGSVCATANCPPGGACCLGDGSCIVRTQVACTGAWSGAGTTCTDVDGDGVTAECGDCNDDNDTIYPGAPELCDGLDNNCDNLLPPAEADGDNDGVSACAGDCNDDNDTIYPGAPELCDGLDNDCDNVIPAQETDDDGDGVTECDGDCDDDDDAVYPGAPEICDGKDSNCDDFRPLEEIDGDGDGVPPCAGDCNDADDTIYPGAPELCDGKDNDCNNILPADEQDDDIDGALNCIDNCRLFNPDQEDCDGNGIGDLCDLIDGTSPDCNANGIPDACDIADGTSEDCNGSGIPDLCETTPEFDPLAALPRQTCAAAQHITSGVTYFNATSPLGAGTSRPLFCGVFFGGNDAFYRYRPAWAGTAFLSVQGPPIDWLVSVHAGCPATTANQVACDDFSTGVEFDVQGGEEYILRFAGTGFSAGPYQLVVLGPAAQRSALDADGNGVPDDCECLADVNGDDVVDGADVLDVMANLGPCPPVGACPWDVDHSGIVNEVDLQIVLQNQGPCPVPPAAAPVGQPINGTRSGRDLRSP